VSLPTSARGLDQRGDARRPVDERPTAVVIADEIRELIEQLRPLVRQVHDLIDTRQPTLVMFTGPETRAAIAQSIRDERADRVDTTDRPGGQQWMRGTTTTRLVGGNDIGRGQALSSTANTRFTLVDLVHRLGQSTRRAGYGVCLLPRLPERPGLGQLADHLAAHARHAADVLPPSVAIPKLRTARRELQRLVDDADVVIDGTRQMPHGNCPHCDRPTILIDFRENVIRCDVDRTTGQLEGCRCGDDYCLCRYKPVEFRHEWRQTKALGAAGWKTFARLRARPRPTPASTPAGTPAAAPEETP